MIKLSQSLCKYVDNEGNNRIKIAQYYGMIHFLLKYIIYLIKIKFLLMKQKIQKILKKLQIKLKKLNPLKK